MAKKTGKTAADSPKDSSINSMTWHNGGPSDQRDELLVQGRGVFFSRSRMQNMASDATRESQDFTAADKAFMGKPDRYATGFLSEATILSLADEIKKQREMSETATQYRDGSALRSEDYQKTCHEGTDAVDPEKDPHSMPGELSNDYKIDRSRSTIHIGCPAGSGTWLNGSAVEHHSFISIDINTPDGRHYATVEMTFDQFASALVSNMAQPCTLRSYWGLTNDAVLLREVVKKPDSITGRLSQRLEARIQELADNVQDALGEVESRLEEGKAPTKGMTEDLIEKIKRMADWYESNTEFTVKQAVEETSSIVEQAAVATAHRHAIEAGDLMTHGGMRMLLGSLVDSRKQLAASGVDKDKLVE